MLVGLNMSASTMHFKTKEKRFLGDIEVLDEHVIEDHGGWRRVKRWLRGVHPHLGVLHKGYTGWETVQEVDVYVATHRFSVV